MTITLSFSTIWCEEIKSRIRSFSAHLKLLYETQNTKLYKQANLPTVKIFHKLLYIPSMKRQQSSSLCSDRVLFLISIQSVYAAAWVTGSTCCETMERDLFK